VKEEPTSFVPSPIVETSNPRDVASKEAAGEETLIANGIEPSMFRAPPAVPPSARVMKKLRLDDE
jgi:hypothetical protein